jgi:hypothetical protein
VAALRLPAHVCEEPAPRLLDAALTESTFRARAETRIVGIGDPLQRQVRETYFFTEPVMSHATFKLSMQEQRNTSISSYQVSSPLEMVVLDWESASC